jgi:hypothetical protein
MVEQIRFWVGGVYGNGGIGVYGQGLEGVYGTGYYGVHGYSSESMGIPYGVYGEVTSPSGRGVQGYASASSGTNYGVYGQSNSPSGYGVYGANTGGGYAGRFDGRVRVNVMEIAGGSDLAEPFEIPNPTTIVPGKVVAIDPEHAGHLRIANQAYDRTVAGCVCGANGINPGLVLKQESTLADGTFPVALSGRVYCWADATYGAIEPGDLLTTSESAGYAMKVMDYPRAQNAILGKAMTRLAQGKGLVLVLVTLQ